MKSRFSRPGGVFIELDSLKALIRCEFTAQKVISALMLSHSDIVLLSDTSRSSELKLFEREKRNDLVHSAAKRRSGSGAVSGSLPFLVSLSLMDRVEMCPRPLPHERKNSLKMFPPSHTLKRAAAEWIMVVNGTRLWVWLQSHRLALSRTSRQKWLNVDLRPPHTPDALHV